MGDKIECEDTARIMELGRQARDIVQEAAVSGLACISPDIIEEMLGRPMEPDEVVAFPNWIVRPTREGHVYEWAQIETYEAHMKRLGFETTHRRTTKTHTLNPAV